MGVMLSIESMRPSCLHGSQSALFEIIIEQILLPYRFVLAEFGFP